MFEEETQELDDQIALSEQRIRNIQTQLDDEKRNLEDLKKKRKEIMGNQPALF